ncbi:MAG: tRNA guanosine(34) transglycosylase Tgt [Bacteroidetes bacterium]|nr:tRNA guanosine(34) transglycosylase Tgt [Bacteroidota bacterium]MBM3423998.1 tRNA guanosine(34) transglycosylase Tgt [Bacteroidota bacterium]
MHFSPLMNDSQTKARTGKLHTDHGNVDTPIFMPVGTAATVKGIHQKELKEEIQAQIVLGNTYHLYMRPGMEVMEAAGGLHAFMHWDGPLLTDSGGYQVYSLANSRKITEEGVRFQSHLDGSYHWFTPESSIDVQRSIGADIIMAFDECTPYPCDYNYAKKSLKLTHDWLIRCNQQMKRTKPKYGHEQTMFPIVQGSVYPDLRRSSAEFMSEHGELGIAIGGLSVGEPEEVLYDMTNVVTDILPKSKARYLMGVGTPWNLLECIGLGIDMFDCVLPSRNARHGLLYTREGNINIKNKRWEFDFTAIDPQSRLVSDQFYTKAYLRHLFRTQENLGLQLATLHNLTFYLDLMKEAREHIENGTFLSWKKQLIPRLKRRL